MKKKMAECESEMLKSAFFSEIMTLWWGSSSWTHLYVDLKWLNRQFVRVRNGESPVALQVQEGVWGLRAFRSDIKACVWAVPYFPVTEDKSLFNQQEWLKTQNTV